MIAIILALLLVAACDVPPAPQMQQQPHPQPRVYSAEEKQLYNCKHLCESQGLGVQRVVTGEHPMCECGEHATDNSPGVGTGVGLGVGLEVGRHVGKHLINELFK